MTFNNGVTKAQIAVMKSRFFLTEDEASEIMAWTESQEVLTEISEKGKEGELVDLLERTYQDGFDRFMVEDLFLYGKDWVFGRIGL